MEGIDLKLKTIDTASMRLSSIHTISFLLTLALLAGCVRVKTEPIRVEPIYIEITVNHRVQQELENVFAEIDKASETMIYEPLESKE